MFPVMHSMVIYGALCCSVTWRCGYRVSGTDDDSTHQPTIETPPLSDGETLLDLTNNGEGQILMLRIIIIHDMY